MGEYSKCECSHCGQPIEYPSEGTGQTVPCPACNRSVFLTPSEPPEPEILVPPVVPPPAPAVMVSKPANPPPPELKSSEPPVPKVLVPPTPPLAKVPAVRVSMSKLPPSVVAGRFDQALLEFERDAEFEKDQLKRDKIGRD